MLLLSRKISDQVIIWEPKKDKIITVTVLGIDGKNIRLGFEAPEYVNIDRYELFQKKVNSIRGIT